MIVDDNIGPLLTVYLHTIRLPACYVEQVQSCFMSWESSILERVDGNIIAIDGKAERGSFTTKDRKNALHMVSAWSCHHGLVLGQEKVDVKSNEITAIPKLLDMLDVEGAIITIDAMGCQKQIAKEIKQQKADYVLALKGNHSGLLEEVKAWFHKAEREQYESVKHSSTEQIE